MQGKNQVTSPFNQDGTALKVHSYWYTIQGEGPDAGRPAIFVRLSHCNLRCYFCDTEFDSGKDIKIDDLVESVYQLSKSNKCNLVVITGGEPLLQNIVPFVAALNKLEISVSIETAGTVYIDGLEKHFHPRREHFNNLIVCSPKTPRLSARIIPLIGALKYIIKKYQYSFDDGLPTVSTQRKGQKSMVYRPCAKLKKGTPIYIQPMDEDSSDDSRANIAAAVAICMKFNYILSMQVHKIVGVA